ncbi:hypothetical protein [Loktanella sp. 5RATIMAR09]|uniref:hypothetical protein n=1 Tax=Loktanella sp. 5RATIMAR09 TaxID=1225655 RepID=UPI000AA4A59E|nr:hypothetical protein [Loktanella sp. 5RATIMAR09]
MADSYLERVAGEIADLALEDAKANGDENIVDVIGEILGSSSQTLQEAFLTAVRVRRAEARARKLLAERAGKPTRVKSRLLPEGEQVNKSAEPIEMGGNTPQASAPEAPAAPQSQEDAAFADALSSLDEFLQSDDTDDTPPPGIQPSRPSRG